MVTIHHDNSSLTHFHSNSLGGHNVDIIVNFVSFLQTLTKSCYFLYCFMLFILFECVFVRMHCQLWMYDISCLLPYKM